jgi:excisionase family DNA binding protein
MEATVLLTAAEAATRLNVRLPRLYELARTGAIPVVRLGRQVRFSPEALAAWVSAGGHALPGGWRRLGEHGDDGR